MGIAFWTMVLLLVVSVFTAIAPARATTTNYTLTGYVYQPSNGPVLAGVGVNLIDEATHQVFTTTTGLGGKFSFSSSSTGSQLSPGWWGIAVPAQAHLVLAGQGPFQWAVLPANGTPLLRYWSASDLGSGGYTPRLTGVSLFKETSNLTGTVKDSNGNVGGATLSLLPVGGSFAVNNTTSNFTTGGFSFKVPRGSWILLTTEPGAPALYNYSRVNVAGSTVSLSPFVESSLVQGSIFNASSGSPVPNGGNVTLLDTSTGIAYSQPTVPGWYSAGTYNGGAFSRANPEQFEVVVSASGYQTAYYPLSGSTGSTTVTRDLSVPAIRPPATFNTTLVFSSKFGKLNVSSTELWGNESVLPDLGNASVGQLWTQLGLDFPSAAPFGQFDGTNATLRAAVLSLLQSQGPFLPTGQAMLLVDGTTFGAPNNATFTSSGIPSSVLGLASNSSLWTNWTQALNGTSAIPGAGNASTYTIAFNFRHPVGDQWIRYNVDLPAGYTLAADTSKPSYSNLVPTGPGSTWTSFALDSLATPSSAPGWGTANFTVVKYSAITAIVNVSVANFTFSSLNVLNSSRANYTAVVGSGQNVTFSASNSTFPDGTNGTSYLWHFGDSSSQSTSKPIAYHTYAAAGSYAGTVLVTSSGGKTNTTGFKVLAGSSVPVPVITSNATAGMHQTSNGAPYLIVNSSQLLYFNVTGSTAPLGFPSSPPGVLSIALWNVTGDGFHLPLANYSASANPKSVNSNYTVAFLGGGAYLANGKVGGQAVPLNGWQYNISLTLWDGAGHTAKTTLPVLVRDHQKPVAVVTIQNSAGKNVTSVVEGSNGTVQLGFVSKYSTDPHNGSIVSVAWKINNTGNSSFLSKRTLNATGPNFANPGTYVPSPWLGPMTSQYTVNLTVTDRAGNIGWSTSQLTVAINASTRPVLSVNNVTAPGSMNEGTSYTIWGNVSNTVGKNSTALSVSAEFYLTSGSSSTGNRIDLVSPSQVQWFNYTNGVVASSPFATGVAPKLAYNATIRALIHWNPGRTGTFTLTLNATCSNEFAGNYGPNTESQLVTLNPNPTTTLLTILAVVVGIIVVVVLLIFYYRRRSRAPADRKSGGTTSKSGLERGGKKESDAKDDDDEE
ncbi:MAG: PKD domain-containing protein [Thermoplasmata archaeon]|nr:PKD domain-containing protein [Thermoplasmata archaeon]